MEIQNTEKRVFPINAVRLCVDQCSNELKGRVYSKLSITALRFDNFSEFLLKTDKLFDRCGYPQSYLEKRNFSSKTQTGSYFLPKALTSDEEILKQKGDIATIDIFVKSRRRAGWQGFLMRPDGRKASEYQSEMGLMHLICSVTGWTGSRIDYGEKEKQEELI